MTKYYFDKTVDLSFEDAIARVTEELKKEGFGILTEIDVQATLKKKLEVDFRPYRILGACNPPFAYKALSAESHIGVYLPCNVIVQDAGNGKTEVAGWIRWWRCPASKIPLWSLWQRKYRQSCNA